MFLWNSLGFSMIQWILAIWSLVPLPFLNPAWMSGSYWITYPFICKYFTGNIYTLPLYIHMYFKLIHFPTKTIYKVLKLFSTKLSCFHISYFLQIALEYWGISRKEKNWSSHYSEQKILLSLKGDYKEAIAKRYQ